jgi:Raf kinase inhibitor-like YbhB/YbcL family protein
VSMRLNWPLLALGGLGIGVFALLVGFFWTRRGNEADIAGDPGGPGLVVTSSSFSDGGTIPSNFTCDGSDISPELEWTATPAKTQSILIFVDDPDAPIVFVHWIAFNLPPSARELPEGASPHTALPGGAKEGENGFGNTGYGGPCPPGTKPHHYVFRVCALDSSLNLPSGAKKGDLATAMKGHVLAEGKIVGLYSRPTK